MAYGVMPGRKGWYWMSGGKVPLRGREKAPPAVPEGPPLTHPIYRFCRPARRRDRPLFPSFAR